MSAINQNLYNNFLQVKPTVSLPDKAPGGDLSATKEAKPLASVSLGEDEKKKSGSLTKVVAGGAIVASVVGVIFARGCSSKIYKNMNSYLQKINDKIAEYTKRKKAGTLTAFEQIGLKFNQKMQKVLEFVNIGNNLTAVKDAGFQHLCEKLHLKKPCDWITAQFKNITKRTSLKSYQRARNTLDTNIPLLRKMKDSITNPVERQRFEELLAQMEEDILKVTSGEQRLARIAETEKATEGVGKKVKVELTRIWRALFKKSDEKKAEVAKLRMYRTEVHSAAGREKLSTELQGVQRKFTFNINDKTDIMSSAKDEIARVIKIEDTEARELLRSLSKQIQQYKKCAGVNEAPERQKVVEALGETMSKLRATMLNGKYSEESQVLLKGKFTEIESVLNQTEQRGNIEELLGILSRNLKEKDPALYNKATNLAKEMRNTVKKAFDDEMKMYDKFAEYSVGSAPTDVLGMLLPLGVAGYSISKGEDKDERVSATLNAGIPIVGGVATTILAAAKMMTNAQGVVLGLLTGTVLNALGSKADQSYKEWNENKQYIAKAVEAYKLSNKA